MLTTADLQNRHDAVFVETKSRTKFAFDSAYAHELKRTYDALLAQTAPVMLYLVTPHPMGAVAREDTRTYLNYCKVITG